MFHGYGHPVVEGVAGGVETARQMVEDHENWRPPAGVAVHWDEDGPYRFLNIGRGAKVRASLDWSFEHFVVH